MTTSLRPGFIDEGGGQEVQRKAVPSTDAGSPEPATSSFARPMLLDLPGEVPTGRIEQDWQPEMVQPVRLKARATSLPWFSAGLMLLLVGWVCLSAAAFVHDQFHRSAQLGVGTLAVFFAALALVLRGLWIEARAFRALKRVDLLQKELAHPDLSVSDARKLCRSWIDVVSNNLPNKAGAIKGLEVAESIDELKAALRNRAVADLDEQAKKMSRLAAMQGAALVAVVPSPALDGIFAGLRGLILIRQIAQLYGVRPGIAVTVSLFRRVARAAAVVAGVDLLAQSAADHLLNGLPVLKHLAGAIPETSLAGLRIYRLGIVTAKACSPVADQ